MGMYDTLIMLGKTAELAPCAHGHAQVDLQTKSLECSLDEYYVYERVLYRKARSRQRIPRARQFEDDKLALRFDSEALRVAHTGAVVAYTHCEECDPIVYEDWGSFHGGVGDRRLWVEYEFEFRDGRLITATTLSRKTREETREQMLRDGVAVLADDDRVARRHLELYRKKAASNNDL
ncbi:MAG TPA: hypothetical protein VN937_00815 [Blastocatellia bacterium]|nr:hypothetical protein [Blastocatellia bacterium]